MDAISYCCVCISKVGCESMGCIHTQLWRYATNGWGNFTYIWREVENIVNGWWNMVMIGHDVSDVIVDIPTH